MSPRPATPIGPNDATRRPTYEECVQAAGLALAAALLENEQERLDALHAARIAERGTRPRPCDP